jgi:hypothetical protein
MRDNQVIINGVNISESAFNITSLFINVPNATNVGGNLDDSLTADAMLVKVQNQLNNNKNQQQL